MLMMIDDYSLPPHHQVMITKKLRSVYRENLRHVRHCNNKTLIEIGKSVIDYPRPSRSVTRSVIKTNAMKTGLGGFFFITTGIEQGVARNGLGGLVLHGGPASRTMMASRQGHGG